ncbi:uncharacterized protein CELE_Y73C8C.12 [Caenorhabditis elegans]|uniref:Uncharacterized protein n=1 Tax=Caenorhabditis elegans TaxID=6239 RepID=Q3V5H1_CAEEL|nr:Uncharacterized protein CELE_Y73C8C.12 [Caenorhabditis elegans]CCD67826.1 Uncharacterized protein CELE_Y73C8C.12 [Caenorhabditis elegans]|eukprot:NP_001033521.1 Uncharacterized protein CELE_Y73C8C.12 [Caenorhabditis elegans]
MRFLVYTLLILNVASILTAYDVKDFAKFQRNVIRNMEKLEKLLGNKRPHCCRYSIQSHRIGGVIILG